MAFKPRHPNYAQRARHGFELQNAMATLGITCTEVGAGTVTFEMPFNKDFAQHHGFMHAGIITTAMDSACGFAAYTLMAEDAEILTVEFKSNFLAPAKGEKFIFRAEVLKPGRTLTVAEAKAYAVQDGQEKLISSMTGTLMALTMKS